MQKGITTVRVFVASPGDTQDERSVISKVVADINLLIGQRERFRLDPILWEESSYPGVGEDAQEVINRQLGDYDLFVGLMSCRFGNPTKRAESGTEEEFERAFRRSIENPHGIRILFYFRNAAVKTLEVDPYQLLQIHSFRQRLQTLGVLYDVYQDVEEFRRKLNKGLTQNVREFLAQQGKPKQRKHFNRDSGVFQPYRCQTGRLKATKTI